MIVRSLSLLFVALCSLGALASAQTPAAPYGNVVQGYTLAWSDEFDGKALDTSKWDYRTDSKHWSTQLPANVSLVDGKLVIALKKEQANGKEYTGGGVISKEAFEHGYYEARFKLPPGGGWHTSFWAQVYGGKTTAPGKAQEIDFCEQDSKNLESYSAGVIAWADMQRLGGREHINFGRKGVKIPGLHDGFHVWACEFTPTVVRFFFDGKLTHETDATQFTHGPQNIWLTCIASHLGGTTAVDDTQLPSKIEFDYVRFYAPLTAAKP